MSPPRNLFGRGRSEPASKISPTRPRNAPSKAILRDEDVYDGRRHLGRIRYLAGHCVAITDGGRRLGKFPNRPAAFDAIMAACRGEDGRA